MSLEKNQDIVRKWFEAENKKDPTLLDEFVTHDLVDYTHQLKGLEEFTQFVNTIYKGFPDFHETIMAIIAKGDKV